MEYILERKHEEAEARAYGAGFGMQYSEYITESTELIRETELAAVTHVTA